MKEFNDEILNKFNLLKNTVDELCGELTNTVTKESLSEEMGKIEWNIIQKIQEMITNLTQHGRYFK